MGAEFTVFRDLADEYRWRLIRLNGDVIATSGEGNLTKQGVLDAIALIKQNAPSAEIDDLAV